VTVYLRSFCSTTAVGAPVGLTSRATIGGKLVAFSQLETSLGNDCTVTYRVTPLKIAKGKTYVVTTEANTKNGGSMTREVTIVGV
jgi:hypothetical protein